MKPLSDLLDHEPDRQREMCRGGNDWLLDLSRLPISSAHFADLTRRRSTIELERAVRDLFAGNVVNHSEDRPALHMALRSLDGDVELPGAAVERASTARRRFLAVADSLHSGAAGVRDVLHIGIGGSDLGPRLIADALDSGDSAVRVHWISTLDGRRFDRLTGRLNPMTTAMVVASKSFGTEETLTQARAFRDWLGPDWSKRSWAVTSQHRRAAEFGFSDQAIIDLPAWVGGRFSLWSAVGLSAAAVIGPSRFVNLLAGAARADAEFAGPGRQQGLAIMLALAIDFLRCQAGLPALGVVSYEPRLGLLADHLQQLVTESLGKSVTVAGDPVASQTSPLLFGGRGTDLQHSLFQALHQGTDTHPLLLIGTARCDHGRPDWHRVQLAHLLGQASVLARGRPDGPPHARLPGQRPAAVLLLDKLEPDRLGWLLASLEHCVFALAHFWQINAFDQWGVEEGKRVAGRFAASLDRGETSPDPSAGPLLDFIRRFQHD